MKHSVEQKKLVRSKVNEIISALPEEDDQLIREWYTILRVDAKQFMAISMFREMVDLFVLMVPDKKGFISSIEEYIKNIKETGE